MMLRTKGSVNTGIQETTQNELELRAGSNTVVQADVNGLKTNALIRNKNEIPTGETWTVASSENAVLVGEITVNGTLVCNGTLVII